MIGINRPTSRCPEAVSKHVLGNFTKDEFEILQDSALHQAILKLNKELK